MKVRCFLEVQKMNFLRKNYFIRLGMAHKCTVVESAGVILFEGYLLGLRENKGGSLFMFIAFLSPHSNLTP